MKYILTTVLIVLLACSFSKAQYVTIPDSNFVKWLNANGYSGCMNGNQLDSSCAAVKNTINLRCNGSNIFDLTGIEGFSHLDSLDCSDNELTSLPYLPSSLTILHCTRNNLGYISSLPPSLVKLVCDQDQLTSMPSLPSLLKVFDCNNNPNTGYLPTLPSSLTTLICYNDNLTGLQPLPSLLTILNCDFNPLGTLPSLPSTLTFLNCNNCQLTSLPSLPSSLTTLYCLHNFLTGLPLLSSSLNRLSCNDNKLSSLPALPSSLTWLDCNTNNITGIPTLPSSLLYFDCGYNTIHNLPALPITLTKLICNRDSLTSLPALPPSLVLLYCDQNNINALPALPSTLEFLECSSNQLNFLPVLPSSLTSLFCDNDKLDSLPALPSSLNSLNCAGNNLTSLPDLPSGLKFFYASYNPDLYCLPFILDFKGGYSDFSISNTGITCLPNVIQHSGYIPAIDTMPVCDITNQNNCTPQWNISGNAYKDDNGNCTQDLSENNLFPLKINLYQSGNLMQSGYFSSNYSFKTSFLTYKVVVDTNNLPFYVSCPSFGYATVSVTKIDSLKRNINFAMKCKPGFDNGVWDIQRRQRFFPGTNTAIYISAGDIAKSMFGSACSSGISGQVKVVIEGPAKYKAPMAGALTPTINGDTVIYTVADFDTINSLLDFNFFIVTDTTAQIGDTICFEVKVIPTSGDNNLSNNTLTHCFTVRASLDPNEKEVSPVGNLPYPYNDWLTYTIHFQNTGTAPAQNIKVLDTLDTNLDAETFQLLSYSKMPLVQIKDSKVAFYFAGINLPDTTTNKDSSMGYVSYRVKPKANLAQGTGINNRASIYFDFNAPVVTNTTSNMIEVATLLSDVNTELKPVIYPNPTDGLFTINLNNSSSKNYKIEITDLAGRILLTQTINAKQSTLNLKSYSAGMYFVRVKTTEGLIGVGKVMLVK